MRGTRNVTAEAKSSLPIARRSSVVSFLWFGALSFLRKGARAGEWVLVVCNFTPVPRYPYRVGVPCGGAWKELLNSDAETYGGSGQGNFGGVDTAPLSAHGRPYMITITVPPLGMVAFKHHPASNP